jgi:hypothetical protein
MLIDIETASQEGLDAEAAKFRELGFRWEDHLAMTVYHIAAAAFMHKASGERSGTLYRLAEVKEDRARELLVEEHVLTRKEAEFIERILTEAAPERAVGIERRDRKAQDYRHHRHMNGTYTTTHTLV